MILTWMLLKDSQFIYSKGSLFLIANLVGKPMKIDEPNVNLSRPSVARICVEVDLLKDLPTKILIGTGCNKRLWQNIMYEDLLSYCTNHRKIGHGSIHCKEAYPPCCCKGGNRNQSSGQEEYHRKEVYSCY